MFTKQILSVLFLSVLSTQLLAGSIKLSHSPDELVLPVSSESDKHKGEVTITAVYNGDPDYDKNEFKIKATQWKFTLTSSEGVLTAKTGKLNEWQTSNAVTCEIYDSKTGSTSITGTVEVKFTFEKINRRRRLRVPDPIIEKVDLEAEKSTAIWFVGVGKLQFKKTTEANWQDFKDANNTTGRFFFKEVKLDFKVTKEPENAPSWPSNFPKWSINNPDTNIEGSEECSGVEVKLDVDGKGDYVGTSKKRTVTAKCGASSVYGEVEAFLYKIYLTSLKDAKEDSPFPSNASFVIKRDRGIGTLSVTFSVVQDATKLDSNSNKRLAIKGTDFTIVMEAVTFAEGETEKTVDASITDDVYFEGDEYFGIQLIEDKKNYSLTAEAENTAAGFGIIKITDNDKLELKKIVFEEIKDLKPDPVPVTTPPTPTHSWGAGPHWEKGKSLNFDPALGYVPVAYSGGTKIKVKATFDGQIDKNPSLDVYSYFETSIASTDYSSDKSDESQMIKLENGTTPDTLSTVTATYTATTELAQKVAYESSLPTKFIYQTKNAANKLTETAASCMYVTRTTPKAGTELYHTTVHIGCSAAHGESEEVKVFE
ncbi:MAG: hypothetical protein LBC02_11305, partial [Planctomycetaceae bacterium]|nr:hypothetical protein [Planctomycetaceae bacterium]